MCWCLFCFERINYFFFAVVYWQANLVAYWFFRTIFLLLILFYPYFNGYFYGNFKCFFIFSVGWTFLFKSKANIFDNVLRNHFLLLLLSNTSWNSNWIWSLNNARKLKTQSVESLSSLFLSKYASSSFNISSNINVLLVEKLALICENPKRFSDASIDFSTEIIYILFSWMLDVLFLTYFLKGVFYLKKVCFLSETDMFLLLNVEKNFSKLEKSPF